MNFLQKLRRDRELRTRVLSALSLAATVAIAAYYGVMAGLYGAIWYATLAGYYGVLVVSRLSVILSIWMSAKRGEDAARAGRRGARTFLATGALLVPLTLALSGVIVLIVVRGEHFQYAGLLIYVAALYAFVKISLAVYHLVRDRNHEDLAVQSLRNLNIADALVSILALQAAMLQAFAMGEGSPDPHVFNAVTGGVIGIVLLAMGSYMIVRGAKYLEMERWKKRLGGSDGRE